MKQSFLLISVFLSTMAYGQSPEFFNSGRLIFGTHVERTASIGVGDIDNDGDMDVLVANGRHWPGQNRVFFNNGDGIFTVSMDLGNEKETSYATELADFDNDGDLDIAVGQSPKFYFHQQWASFGSKNGNTRNIVTADLDNDGDVDILITTGLKEDGEAVLDYISGRKIAIDFSHTSDALAYGILDYLEKHNLDIPVLASHSNYREVFDHPRNLPDDIAREIIRRKGLIGVNFVRAFLNDTDSNAIYDHIDHGIGIGGAESICFGADYFHMGSHPDLERNPYYFKEQENASCYPSIVERLSERISSNTIDAICNQNVVNYLKRIWS